MHVYTMKYTSQLQKETQVKMYSWTGNLNPGPLHDQLGALPLSYPGQLISLALLGQITTILPLQSLCPIKETHNKHMFNLSGLIDLTNLTNACIVTAPNVTEKGGTIEINNIF